MPIRKHKKYSKPRRAYDKQRIEQEDGLVKQYGLKSKREIWKSEAAIKDIRERAKSLLTKSDEEQKKFIDKLNIMGFRVENIADILALNKEDYLKRRLQSIIVKQKIANTPKHARQLIAHKHIAINGKKINSPSYVVRTDEEDKITLTIVKKLKEEKAPEVKLE
jgi:small subunit ribosomal protein S4